MRLTTCDLSLPVSRNELCLLPDCRINIKHYLITSLNQEKEQVGSQNRITVLPVVRSNASSYARTINSLFYYYNRAEGGIISEFNGSRCPS